MLGIIGKQCCVRLPMICRGLSSSKFLYFLVETVLGLDIHQQFRGGLECNLQGGKH